jgi:hypothetical protein
VTRGWATALDLSGPRHAQWFVDPDDFPECSGKTALLTWERRERS